MKRVLFVTPRFPYPLHSGGERWVYFHLQELAKRHEVSLFNFFSPGLEVAQSAVALFLEKHTLQRVWTLPHPSVDQRDPVCALPLPPFVEYFHSERAVSSFRRAIDEFKPDLVHFNFLEMAHYVAYVPDNTPSILTDHDCSHFWPENSYVNDAGDSRSGVRPWQERLQHAKEYYPRFKGIVTLSTSDAALLRGEFPDIPIRMIPTSIDVSSFAQKDRGETVPREERSLVFVGHYPHHPNEDAAVYFVREILPLIQRDVPEVKVYLVGSLPTPPVQSLASDSVIVTGSVPEVLPYLQRASVFIAPMRLGGGMKGKVLEAFAAGLPVVGTANVAEGFDEPDKDALLLAGGPKEFAEKTIALLKDQDLRRRLTSRAAEVVKKFDVNGTAAAYSQLYEDVISGKQGSDHQDHHPDHSAGAKEKMALVLSKIEKTIGEGTQKITIRKREAPIKELHIELTHRCDLKCFMCEHWTIQFKDKESPKREMSAEEIKQWVCGSQLLNEVEQIVITGGEPWLKHDIVPIVSFLRKRFADSNLIVLTNFWNTESIRRKLNELHEAGVSNFQLGSSLDGVGDMHDRVRGQPGAFKGLVKTMELIKKEYPGIGFGFTFTITPVNYKSLYETFEYVTERLQCGFGAQFVVETEGIDPIRWTPEALDDVERQIDRIMLRLCGDQETQRMMELFLDEKPNPGAGLWRELAFWWYLRKFGKKQEPLLKECMSGQRYAMFDPEGNLFFCPVGRNRIVGNVRQTPLDELWRSSQADKVRQCIETCQCRAWIRCIAHPILDRALAAEGR